MCMCICMCMCMCMYVNEYTGTSTRNVQHVHVDAHAHAHAHAHVHIHVHEHEHGNGHTMRTHMHMHMHVPLSMHMHMSIFTALHTSRYPIYFFGGGESEALITWFMQTIPREDAQSRWSRFDFGSLILPEDFQKGIHLTPQANPRHALSAPPHGHEASSSTSCLTRR